MGVNRQKVQAMKPTSTGTRVSTPKISSNYSARVSSLGWTMESLTNQQKINAAEYVWMREQELWYENAWDEYDGLTLGRHEKSRNALKVANWGAESSDGWIGSSWSLDSLDTVLPPLATSHNSMWMFEPDRPGAGIEWWGICSWQFYCQSRY